MMDGVEDLVQKEYFLLFIENKRCLET